LGCIGLKSLDLSNFDVSNVTNMQSTFHTCYNLEYLNLNNWDMKKVILFPYLFYECDVLTNISMNDSDYISVNKVISQLPELNTNSGKLSIKRIDVLENVNIDTASSKNWNVV
jgi:surface protein